MKEYSRGRGCLSGFLLHWESTSVPWLKEKIAGRTVKNVFTTVFYYLHSVLGEMTRHNGGATCQKTRPIRKSASGNDGVVALRYHSQIMTNSRYREEMYWYIFVANLTFYSPIRTGWIRIRNKVDILYSPFKSINSPLYFITDHQKQNIVAIERPIVNKKCV